MRFLQKQKTLITQIQLLVKASIYAISVSNLDAYFIF